MSQWYLSYDSQRYGPYDTQSASQYAQKRPDGFAWKEGYTSWLPLRQIDELFPGAPADAPVPPPTPTGNACRADEIDYVIYGGEMQYVEIELDPGESALAEAGSMMYKEATVDMQTIFGDGSDSGGGAFNKLLGAGKRILTGESLFMTLFTHTGQVKARVAFGAPYPGSIIPVKLDAIGGSIICQKDAFLCAAKGVCVDMHFQKKLMSGFFGGEGFIMQKLSGDGWAFLHAGGSIAEKQLEAGEELHVDTGCVVAYEPSVDFEIIRAGNIKSMVFGGEGFFFARLRGPGKIWLQSLPFARLAGRVLANAVGSQQKGEGSALGSIGGFINGDNG